MSSFTTDCQLQIADRFVGPPERFRLFSSVNCVSYAVALLLYDCNSNARYHQSSYFIICYDVFWSKRRNRLVIKQRTAAEWDSSRKLGEEIAAYGFVCEFSLFVFILLFVSNDSIDPLGRNSPLTFSLSTTKNDQRASTCDDLSQSKKVSDGETDRLNRD
ncbi:hypothetical protein F2P81_023670 [Scophthalmus maximus]|uniref:Uncharacterized protein n=1 Tax=Scophthalmus maximus TaxID=52904 RepID=A0A6A4RY58_SCOMX|nr:hypothetical protein F2P81_023670 [Scophthalmus maximus]